MSDANRQVAAVSKRDLVTMDFAEALDIYAPNFAAELPSHIPVERFKRTIITAVNINPELRKADRRSLFNACVKCAHDGLYPDGQEAALVVFNTKVKNEHGQEVWVPLVQYLPMIKGIRKRMRNSGEVLSAIAEVVHRNDKFRFVKGEDPRIEHEPAAIDKDPGDPVGAYAIIRLSSGEILRDVMSKHEIERSRAQSKAPNSLMWTKFWGEGAKKTVMRHCSKQAPADSELERLMARDEELPEAPSISEMRAIPDRPRREDFIEPEAETSFAVVDIGGEICEFAEAGAAARTLHELLQDGAHDRGEDGIEAVWEDNAALISALREHGHDATADDLRDKYAALIVVARNKKATPEPLGVTGNTPEFDSGDPGSNPGGAATRSFAIEPHKPAGKPIDWEHTRADLCAAAYSIASPADLALFRRDNRVTIQALGKADAEAAEQVENALRDREIAMADIERT